MSENDDRVQWRVQTQNSLSIISNWIVKQRVVLCSTL